MSEVWFKSSYSSDAGGNCVEVANLTPTHAHIALRDSKFPQGHALLQPEAFSAFVDHVRMPTAFGKLKATPAKQPPAG